MKTREMLAKSQQADFLAPYFVRFEDKKPQREEVDVAIQDCLRDFRKNSEDMINELQRRYDEATAEMNSLKRFLHRYMDQFSIQEYEKFIQEG
jgi:molecular chaperone GrpE (heat shock protein)